MAIGSSDRSTTVINYFRAAGPAKHGPRRSRAAMRAQSPFLLPASDVRFRPACAIPARSLTRPPWAGQWRPGKNPCFLDELRTWADLRSELASEMQARAAVNVTEPLDPIIGRVCDE